jgi:hypothetical protein
MGNFAHHLQLGGALPVTLLRWWIGCSLMRACRDELL